MSRRLAWPPAPDPLADVAVHTFGRLVIATERGRFWGAGVELPHDGLLVALVGQDDWMSADERAMRRRQNRAYKARRKERR